MIETNIPEINVDELMEKIREEVRRRKAQKGKADQHPPGPHQASQATLFPRIDPLNIGTIPEPESFELKEGGYHINDFLMYHDLHFVMNAYRGILRRRPDSEGLRHFLESLRSGHMSKAEVLGRLRYASEGRVKKVKIKGLFWNFVVQSSFRIPVLGYFSRLTIGIINLPVIIRNLNTLEANTFAQLQAQHNHINTLADAAQFKINELIDKHGQVGPVLDQKADKLELSELGDRKADRDELGQLKEEVEGVLERKTDKEQIEPIKNEISEILRQTRDNKLNILDQQRRLVLLLEEARKRLPEPISTDQIKKMLTEEDHLLDAMYVSFEDQFRGTRQEIKEKLKVYLPYLQKVNAGMKETPVLDLGCGRGEWLELCQENNLIAIGIDINKVMISQCKDFGLDVVESDLVSFLRDQKPNAFGAITGFHILEHLPLKTMISVLDETLRTIQPGGVAIFETPNPENLVVGAFSFYLDPTHRNPLVPESMRFFFEQRGFCNVHIKRLHKNLQYFEAKTDNDFKNKWFYSEMDYAIIGYKQ